MSAPCPAHASKHLHNLVLVLNDTNIVLAQSQDGVSNGTTLWLGGQVLALYLAETHTRFKPHNRAPRAFELGSGIGLTVLALSSLGWDVVATDIPYVITSVLRSNLQNNQHVLPPGSGTIHLRELDWFVDPAQWLWNHPTVIASIAPAVSPLEQRVPAPPYDLICTADTVYDPALIEPLLRSLHTLSTLSAATSKPPLVLVCIERRDPALVDHFLNQATTVWNFTTERVTARKIAKLVQKHYPHWEKDDWQGVELWKLRLITNPRSVDERK